MISFGRATQANRPQRPTSSGPPATVRPGEQGDAGIRPFVMTGGRTVPVDDRLRIETQVVATGSFEPTNLDPERRRILGSCRTPLSVAEVAAAVRLPLGVARVLIADLAVDGLIAVHSQNVQPSRAMIERILEKAYAL
jgi:hypothetical protein